MRRRRLIAIALNVDQPHARAQVKLLPTTNRNAENATNWAVNETFILCCQSFSCAKSCILKPGILKRRSSVAKRTICRFISLLFNVCAPRTFHRFSIHRVNEWKGETQKTAKNTGATIPISIYICCMDSVKGNLRTRHVPWRKHALDRLGHFLRSNKNRVIVAVGQFRVCARWSRSSHQTVDICVVRVPLVGHRKTWMRPTIDLPADDELSVWEKCTQRVVRLRQCVVRLYSLFLICYSIRFDLDV